MMSDRLKAALLAGVASASFASIAEAGVFVDAASSTPIAVGSVIAGQNVIIGVMGQSDIYQPTAAILRPTGAPSYDMSGGANAAFMPNGSPFVPGTTSYGIAGPSVNLGALVGTYNPSPTQSSDFFVIGAGGSFTPSQSGTLYAMINDQYYADNCGGVFLSLGSGSSSTQSNFACASTPPSLSPTPIASVTAGHYYQFSASGSEVLGDGGPGLISSPVGIAPTLNGYNTGALLLSLVPNPTSAQIIAPDSYGAYKFNAPADATLYAWVNSSSYWQNSGGFMTQLTDIPEPMSLAIFLAGLAFIGSGQRLKFRRS